MTMRNKTSRSGCQPSIIDFYDPNVNGGDGHTRTRAEILSWGDEQLETSHDYIQVLFPLPENSMFNYNSPIIDSKTLEAFRSRVDLQMSLSDAFVRMLHFYGFEAVGNVFANNHPEVGFEVVRGPNFEERSKNWCVRMDHNHLRITRILRCLRVLGLQTQCEAFYKVLKDVYNDPKIKISERSMMFWTRAMREPLHIAPDGTECKWLKKWQEDNQAHD